MHPATLLTTLACAAAIAGAFCWNRFQRIQFENRRSDASYSSSPAGPTPAPVATPADGTPLTPATDLAPGATDSSETGRLQRMVQDLQDQLDKINTENKDLRERLAKEIEARTPPPKVEDLAARLEEMRKLQFKSIPSVHTAPLSEIQEMLKKEVAAQIPDGTGEARTRAYLAMGFTAEPFDYRKVQESLASANAVAHYDAAGNALTIQNDAELKRADGRERLMTGLHRALAAQHCQGTVPLPVGTDQDDANRALRALALGENAFYRIQWSVKDDYPKNYESGPPPESPQPAYVPLFFNEEYKFSADAGQQFVETLLQKGGEAALSAAYAKPPRSTTEILHPDLYLADPAFSPIPIPFDNTPVNSVAPLFSNVAGEMGIHFMLRVNMQQDLCLLLSEGWAGDRYIVYPGSPEHGDHIHWKIIWRTERDGRDFFHGMKHHLMQRFTIPFQKEYDQPRAFIVNDPHRVLRLRHSENFRTVTLVNATDPAFADALDAKFPPP